MKLNVQSRGFKLTKSLYNHTDSKIHRLLKRYDDRINRVKIILQDINGPKGGQDMKCLVSISVINSKSIVVQERAADLYDAINACGQRVRLAMERHVSRTRRLNRRRSNFALSHASDSTESNTASTSEGYPLTFASS